MMISKKMQYINSLENALRKIDSSILEKIATKLRTALNNNSIYIIGNGGSAANALHWQCDLENWNHRNNLGKGKCCALCSNVSLLTAIGNDYDFSDIYVRQLQSKIEEKDVLIILSSSGKSADLVKAARFASGKGAIVISIVGDFSGEVIDYSDISLIVDSKNYGIVEDIQVIVLHSIVGI